MKFISPYHKETNGRCERLNGVTRKCLAMIASINGETSPEQNFRWYNYVEYINFIHNITPVPDTKVAPWLLRWNENPPDLTTFDLKPLQTDFVNRYGNIGEYFKGITKLKTELREKARLNIEEHTRKKYDKFLKIKQPDRQITIGSIIYKKRHNFVGNERKLKPKFYGPYKVIASSNSGSFQVAPFDPTLNRYVEDDKDRLSWTNQADVKVLSYGDPQVPQIS